MSPGEVPAPCWVRQAATSSCLCRMPGAGKVCSSQGAFQAPAPTLYKSCVLQPCKPKRMPRRPALLQLHPGHETPQKCSVLRVRGSDSPEATVFYVCCLALLLLSLFLLIKINTPFTMSTDTALSIPVEKQTKCGPGQQGHAPSLREPPPIP